MQLYLLEPPSPGPAWAPFTGVRPVCELRAGVWRIRERWEAVLQAETASILGDHVAGFQEGDEPRVRPGGSVDGPAIVAASWFAPSGAPIEVGPGVRRLAAESESVAWLVAAGEQWTGPHDSGRAATIEGLTLGGTADLISALEAFLKADCADFLTGERDPVPAGSIVLGDAGQIVCRGAQVEPGVVFDVRGGVVVLEEGVEVRSGSRLEGPLYAGPGSRLLGGHLRASVFGPSCSVKGEIAASVFVGFANKSHDGFVGHSVIGHWVNLGAGTTTSNLKNTYGIVSLQAGEERLSTGRQFLGSLIGDHAKTAIGTMLPTGTVVGAGAHLFGEAGVPKWVPPFAWGSRGDAQLSEEGFLRIAERVMPRRQVAFTPERRASLSATYRRLTGA